MQKIDARIIILQLIFISFGMILTPSVKATILQILTLSLFLAYLGAVRQSLKLLSYFIVLSFIYQLFMFWQFPFSITQFLFILRKTTPIIGTLYLALHSVSVSELLSGMIRLKIPKSIALSVAIALRFLPTIRYENQQVTDSLKTKGLAFGIFSFLKSPIQQLEYRMVPFMMRSIKIADELSMSAATRAIENPCIRGERIELRLKFKDIIYLCLVVLNFTFLIMVEKGMVL